jgi:sulfate adenylyltransferase
MQHGPDTLSNDRGAAEGRRRDDLPAVVLRRHEVDDLIQIGRGGLAPLKGYLGARDYRSVLEHLRLADGTPWPLPIVLPVAEDSLDAIRAAGAVRLAASDGRTLGRLVIGEIHRRDRELEAHAVYRTTDASHPGVRRFVLEGGEHLLAGPVEVLPEVLEPAHPLDLTPALVRTEIARRGWRTVAAFQTRNPVHRAHEYLQKCALEVTDGLLVHPLVGETKDDDVPVEVRLDCYRAVIDAYFPAFRVLLATLRLTMRFAGPREAILHALVRRNHGATHFIVGRDHAGHGDAFGPYEAQEIFRTFTPGELGIEVLPFENAFHCTRCGAMATGKTCPHTAACRIELSGTRVREKLRAGEDLPPEFSRREVSRILRAWVRGEDAGGRAGRLEGGSAGRIGAAG